MLLVLCSLLSQFGFVVLHFLLSELELSFHLSGVEQPFEIILSLHKILVLLRHHILVELQLLDLVGQLGVDAEALLLLLIGLLQLFLHLVELAQEEVLTVLVLRAHDLFFLRFQIEQALGLKLVVELLDLILDVLMLVLVAVHE